MVSPGDLGGQLAVRFHQPIDLRPEIVAVDALAAEAEDLDLAIDQLAD